jgi:hypothetical protein
MREAGLFLVYMGIESGVESGLDVLFKQMTVEQNLDAVATSIISDKPTSRTQAAGPTRRSPTASSAIGRSMAR